MFRKLRKLWRKLPPWVELSIVALVAIVFIAFGAAIIWATLTPIPAINNFENREVAQSTKIYDRTGNVVLYDVHGQVRRTAVTLDQISPYIQKATVAVEDDTFYTNAGFRPLSFLRALFANLSSGSYAQGGSTITQQVVKNALLTQDKTILRKIEEIILALRLTRVYTKDQILNTYLNETSYGGTVYGVQEASQYYFGVDAKDVDLAQAAYLAAIPQAPTHYSPYGDYKSELDTRKNFVLSRMETLGYITADEYTEASTEQVQFQPQGDSGIKAPHVVFYIENYLEQKYGTDAVDQSGLHVITTLDYDLQQKAEAVVSKWAPQMETNFNASNEGVVAIDPKTGQILAMVGSKDYFDDSIDGQVNVTLANRQPGSSFKPFVWLAALEKGETPDTTVLDAPIRVGAWSPEDFERRYLGEITLEEALAQSINTASVRLLLLAGGPRVVAGVAARLGIADKLPDNASLALGTGEVGLLELSAAYAAFFNGGHRVVPFGVERVQADGRWSPAAHVEPVAAIDPDKAAMMARMLAAVVARGTGRAASVAGHTVAGKTGTTQDFRDAWFIGWIDGAIIGVWLGNDNDAPMKSVQGGSLPARLFHEIAVTAR
jgi:penicillin-binding protein 1A